MTASLAAAPLMLASLAFVAGVATATGFASTAVELGVLAGIAAAGGVIASQRQRCLLALGLLLPLLFAAGLGRADDGAPQPGSIADLTGRRLEITGVLLEDAARGGRDQEFRLAAESVALGSERLRVEGTVLLRAPLGPSYRYGDRVRVIVTLRALPDDRASAFRDFLADRGISATGTAGDVTVLERDQGDPLRAAVTAARREVDQALARALDEPLAGLAQGIATGRRDTLNPALRADLNATSLSHLVVISGSNVVILATLIVAGLAWIIGRRWAVFVALASIGVYTVFVGADAPVVRAAIMATMFLLAGVLGRRGSAAPAVAFTAAIMLAITPGTITDLSFQLSFAATSALAVLASPLHERMTQWIGLHPESQGFSPTVARTLLETAVVTVAATAATLPLIALHFERISIVALPANLLVAPIFPFLFLGSLITGIAGAISESLGESVGWVAAWLPLSWFVEVGEGLADLPFASARIDGFGLEHAFVLYGAGGAVGVWLHRRRPAPSPAAARTLAGLQRPLPWLAAGVLMATNVVVWWVVAAGSDGALTVHALDVGQGDAILIQAPSGRTILIDGGPNERTLIEELSEALPAGHREIDLVVATHPQADHISGLFAVLDRYRVGALLVTPENERTAAGRRLAAAARERGVPVQALALGDRLLLADDITLDVIAPAPSLGLDSSSAINDGGLVLRLIHGEVQFLLAADIEAAGELALALGPGDLRATVLKVAHHGSRSSTTDLLLRRVQPAIVVISAGAGNRFGHPHAEVLDRLSGATLLRTDHLGTITFRSDGATLRYHSERSSP